MVFFFVPRGYGPGKEDWLLYMVGGACTLTDSACTLDALLAAACEMPPPPPPHFAPLLAQGLDKYENEDLIKYALPQDVWFHVDALSSAHVYLRMPEGAVQRREKWGWGSDQRH
jgi:phospholipase C